MPPRLRRPLSPDRRWQVSGGNRDRPATLRNRSIVATVIHGARDAVIPSDNQLLRERSGQFHGVPHAIVDLWAQGKRIGVASNSHKAINNLLEEIESQALERKFTFRGAKKCSDDDHEHAGSLIVNLRDNAEVSAGQFDLIAGTAWLFSRQEFDQTVDYLFIDEAGQVALANVVAMGLSARNIVLVGDQMQLSQPAQGVHPGESGRSALQLLLSDAATVPLERGIFLPGGSTRRASRHRSGPPIFWG